MFNIIVHQCLNFIWKSIKFNLYKFLQKQNQKSTVIFADPPYAFSIEQFSKISELVFQNDLLYNDGILIIEHSKHTDLSNLSNYQYSKSYGGNMFSFFS